MLTCPEVERPRCCAASDVVQQAIVDGRLQAALALLPEQGPVAAKYELLEVLQQSAVVSAGQPLLER
jgi:hypothetical protein